MRQAGIDSTSGLMVDFERRGSAAAVFVLDGERIPMKRAKNLKFIKSTPSQSKAAMLDGSRILSGQAYLVTSNKPSPIGQGSPAFLGSQRNRLYGAALRAGLKESETDRMVREFFAHISGVPK